MRSLKTFLAIVQFAATTALPSAGQEIVIDWPTETVSCPDTINFPTRVRYVVRDINDMLFDYQVQVDLRPRETFDFERIRGGPESGSLVATCESKANEAVDVLNPVVEAFRSTPNLKPDCDATEGECNSVSLASTLGSWQNFSNAHDASLATVRARIAEAEEIGSCKAETTERIAAIRRQLGVFESWNDKAAMPHERVGSVSLSPDVDVDITVYEKYTEGGVRYPTDKNAKKFTCTPRSNFLTLSAGTLVSTLSARTFRTVAVPKSVRVPDPNNPGETIAQTSDETFNALAVDHGNGISPHAAALLNYRLPLKKLPKWMGFSLSSGPVYRLAGDTEASSLGYFAGVSWTLLDRFFLTPGVHLAEFSDFPIGFSEGSFVPSGIGNPSPIKRWTGRFGLSLSYRSKNLGGPKIAGAANNIEHSPEQAPGAGETDAPLAIRDKELPDAVKGQPYTFALEATGGAGDYSWALKTGSELPAGLALQGNIISGEVTADAKSEPYTFTVVATSGDVTAERELSLIVKEQGEA